MGAMFRLKEVKSSEIKNLLRDVLQEQRKECVTDDAELDAEEVFRALDVFRTTPNQETNGIANWNDYQSLISGGQNRKYLNASFRTFQKAVLFVEQLRWQGRTLSPTYQCELTGKDGMRTAELVPDEAVMRVYDMAVRDPEPRFKVEFTFKDAVRRDEWPLFRNTATVDMVMLKSGEVRLELFRDAYDRMRGRPVKTQVVGRDEIQSLDQDAVTTMMETTRAINENDASNPGTRNGLGIQRSFTASDRLVGFLWQFALSHEVIPPSSIASSQLSWTEDDTAILARPYDNDFAVSCKDAPSTESMDLFYRLYALPRSVSLEELPKRILSYSENNLSKAVQGLREKLLNEVFTALPRSFAEDFLETIFQSSFLQTGEGLTDEKRLLIALTKVDLLFSVTRDERHACNLFRLPRGMLNTMFLYVFKEYPAAEVDVEDYRRLMGIRLGNVLVPAERIAERYQSNANAAWVLSEFIGDTMKWFPEMPLEPDVLRRTQAIFGADQRNPNFYEAIDYLYADLYDKFTVRRALKVIAEMVSKMQLPGNDGGDAGRAYERTMRKIAEEQLVSPVTLNQELSAYCGGSAKACWPIIALVPEKDLAATIGRKHAIYIKSNNTIQNQCKVIFHELMHGAQNYGRLLGNMSYDDLHMEGKGAKGRVPVWFSEALAEYFAQKTMRQYGLDPREDNYCGCKSGMFALRALVRVHGEPFEEALRVAHFTGDFTAMKTIVNQDGKNVYQELMVDDEKEGTNALRVVRKYGIQTTFDDWR